MTEARTIFSEREKTKEVLPKRLLEYKIFSVGRIPDELGTPVDKVETWFTTYIGLREGFKLRIC